MKEIRVSIVEDDEDFANILSNILRRRGYKVGLAFSGEEALDKFRHEDFDVALLDFKLPGINGLETFQKLLKFNPEIKVFLITGFNTEQILDQIVGSDCWEVLHKPLDKKNTLESIERIGSNGVLITDDNPSLIKNIKELLEEEGKKVFIARKRQEAVERIHSNSFDILILDFDMPIINELVLYIELKKIGHTIPTIIVMPQVAEEEDMFVKLTNTSVSGIMKKPINPKELLDILELIRHKNKMCDCATGIVQKLA